MNLMRYLNDRRGLRGGSWLYYGLICRSAVRINAESDIRNSNSGFRVVVRTKDHDDSNGF